MSHRPCAAGAAAVGVAETHNAAAAAVGAVEFAEGG